MPVTFAGRYRSAFFSTWKRPEAMKKVLIGQAVAIGKTAYTGFLLYPPSSDGLLHPYPPWLKKSGDGN